MEGDFGSIAVASSSSFLVERQKTYRYHQCVVLMVWVIYVEDFFPLIYGGGGGGGGGSLGDRKKRHDREEEKVWVENKPFLIAESVTETDMNRSCGMG